MNIRNGRRARRTLAALLAVLLAFGTAGSGPWTPVRAEAVPANLAVNPGFEASGDDWIGWTYDGTLKDGDTPAVFIHTKPGTGDVHSGSRSLGYWLDEPFSFTLTQTLSGLADGIYELTAWAEGGDAALDDASSLKLFAESGGLREEALIALTGWGDWREYSLAIQVTGGEAVIGFAVDAPAGQWGAFDDVTFQLKETEPDEPGGPAGPVWGSGKSLQPSELTPRSVKLQWTAAADSAGVAYYRIYQDGKVRATVPGTVQSYRIANLQPNTAYQFKVEAANAGGLWTSDGPETAVTTPDGPAAKPQFIKGADISTLQAIEDAGGKYYDNGVERDLLDILKDRGVNAIRLRIWNDPVLADGYNDKAHTVEMAKRVKTAGLNLLIDFHYSDFWADPGKQEKPAAWEHLDFAGLNQAVYEYTAEVLNDLQAVGAYPDMVQIGNEINNGMLLPDGSTSRFDQLAELISSGIRAVRDTTPPGREVKVMIHLAEGGDNGRFRSFFDALTAYTNDFEIIGLSFYPYWHGTYAQLKHNLNDLASRYGKELNVVETAHPYTLEDGDGWPNIAGAAEAAKAGFPATPEGQVEMLTMMMNIVAQTEGGLGTGIFYWEPAWIPVPRDENGDFQAGWKTKEGNAWDNQALFDFAGNALPSLDAFRFDPANLPAKAPVRVLNPDGITIPALEPAEDAAARLPREVRVLFNEGSIESVPVEWTPLDPDRLSRIGTFRLAGQTAGLDLPAEVAITVTAYRNLAVNGGFEAGFAMDGWDADGTADAVKVDGNAGNARSGSHSLNYWYGSDYAFTVSQTITGLPDGLYTLRVQASGGGGENILRLFADEYGGERRTVDMVNTGWNEWKAYTIEDINVSNGQIVFGVEVEAPAETWGFLDDFELFRRVMMPEWGGDARLEAVNVGAHAVRLQWSGIVDPALAAGYKIYKDGVLEAVVEGGGNSCNVTGLSPGTAYTFQVEAGSDAGIWTGDGPSVTVTTRQPASGGPSGPPPQQEPEPAPDTGDAEPADEDDVWTVPEEELTEPGTGPLVFNVPDRTYEVRLPVNTADLLGDRTLEVRRGRLILHLPAAVLEQLAGEADDEADMNARAAASAAAYTAAPNAVDQSTGDRAVAVLSAGTEAYLSIRLGPPAAPEDWIDRAEQRMGIRLTPLAPLVDLRLSRVDEAGKAFAPATFSEPVTIRLQPDGAHDPERTGIFLMEPDGALRHTGGRGTDEWTAAELTAAGVYGLFEAAHTFADLPEHHWAHRAVAVLAARLVVTGTDSAGGRFEPNRTVTRAEFTAMIARLLQLPDDASGPSFADVPDDAWHASAARAARAAGIAAGDSSGMFRPNAVITREEMAVLLARAAAYAGMDAAHASASSAFTDADFKGDASADSPAAEHAAYADDEAISAWARDAVRQVTALGLMHGLPDGTFAPQGTASRAEAAQALYRLGGLEAER